jgi:uncharacterized protein (TIGR03083 family)
MGADRVGWVTDTDSVKINLREAASSFAALVEQVPDDAWQVPALGSWTVRDLVGHTSRALITVETYLAKPADLPSLAGPVAYYLAAGAIGPAADAVVAERGRQAGRDLGPHPHDTIVALAERVVAEILAAPLGAVLSTPFGAITLRDYLPTRIFELTVHSLDLAAALQIQANLPDGALHTVSHLATDLALAKGLGPGLLLALTGRRPLREHTSVV